MAIILVVLLSGLIPAGLALASSVDITAVVDVTVPTGSVILAPGASGAITINMRVTGNQEGTATFEVSRDWTLSGGTFTGPNPETFTVNPRAPTDPATTFSTTGTVTVDSGQSAGTFTLAVSAFAITNTNTTGAKLTDGSDSNYQVTVSAPPTDTTPPVITRLGDASVTVQAGSTYTDAGATALDNYDGVITGSIVTVNPVNTAVVGIYTVTYDVKDAAGNAAIQVTRTVDVVYKFGGILQPINPDGSSIFKLGSTVPVKFQLRDANGNFVTNAVANISVVKMTGGSTSGAVNEAVSTSAATTGTLFRYDLASNQYIFNLNTKPLSTGTWRITITVDDVTLKDVKISLR